METISRLLTVAEIAQRLGRSQEQVRRYLREGKLRGQRIGNQWFVDADDLPEIAALPRSKKTEVLQERWKLFERVNRRRERVRRRWEKMGIHVDAVKLVRELREER